MLMSTCAELVAGTRPRIWTESRTHRLIELRRDGLPNAEIAARLGVPLGALNTKVRELVRKGALGSRKHILRSHPDARIEGYSRKARDVAPDVARLYERGASYEEIAFQLELTRAQVHNLLTRLFAAGLPKRPRRQLSDAQVRAIYAAYLEGESIDELAAAIGFTGSAVRTRIHKLELPLRPASRR